MSWVTEYCNFLLILKLHIRSEHLSTRADIFNIFCELERVRQDKRHWRGSAMVNCVLFGAILLLISVGSCIASRSFCSSYEGPTPQTKGELRNCVPSIVNATCDEENITLVFTLLPITGPQVTLLLAKYQGSTKVITWNSREPVGIAKLNYTGRNKERRASIALLNNVTKLKCITASEEKFFKFSSSQLPSNARWISSLVTQKDGHFIPSSSLEFILQSLKDTMIQRLEITGCIEGRPTQPLLLRSMPEIQYVDISNNETEEFVVGIPTSIQNTQHLILQKNAFNEIPQDLKQLGHVRNLDISQNRKMLRHHNLWFIKIALQKLEWCRYELKLTSHVLIEENTRPLILVQVRVKINQPRTDRRKHTFSNTGAGRAAEWGDHSSTSEAPHAHLNLSRVAGRR